MAQVIFGRPRSRAVTLNPLGGDGLDRTNFSAELAKSMQKQKVALEAKMKDELTATNQHQGLVMHRCGPTRFYTSGRDAT